MQQLWNIPVGQREASSIHHGYGRKALSVESSKGYSKFASSYRGQAGCICLAIECDSPRSLKVHGAHPTVCTQRKIKSAHPPLWSSVLTDLSRVSLSSLCQPLMSQACWVSGLPSYCMCTQTDYKFTTSSHLFMEGILYDR